MGELRILDSEKGDYKVIWDAEKEDEVNMAEKQFNELKKKGYQAFYVGRKGKKTEQMKEFDSEAGMVIMAPLVAGG